jgi:hypothetical protein
VEGDERREKAEVGDEEAGRRVAEAQCVPGSQQDREEREERRIALPSRHEQIARARHDPVPAPVPGLERPEGVRVRDVLDPAGRAEVMDDDRGGDDHGPAEDPPARDPDGHGQTTRRFLGASEP